MSNIQLDTDPQYNESMQAIEVTTPVHADVMNERFKQLLENEKYLEGTKANKTDIPSIPDSLPADGGNADTVNGFTVESNVPANAKFTDTIYTHPATHPASMITGLPTSLPANGGNADTVDGYHVIPNDGWGLKSIAFGTSDMIAGSTPLGTGNIYMVYE